MTRARIAGVVLAMLLLAGCSKVSLDNYNKLERGMDRAEVEKILGSPTSCDEALGVRNCIWGTEKSNITVTFAGTKVLNMGHTGIN